MVVPLFGFGVGQTFVAKDDVARNDAMRSFPRRQALEPVPTATQRRAAGTQAEGLRVAGGHGVGVFSRSWRVEQGMPTPTAGTRQAGRRSYGIEESIELIHAGAAIWHHWHGCSRSLQTQPGRLGIVSGSAVALVALPMGGGPTPSRAVGK